jgi:hypothetical protein
VLGFSGVVAELATTLKTLLVGEPSERGQAGFEYLLTMGAVSVVVAGFIVVGFEGLVQPVLQTLCDTVDPLGAGSCLS